MSADTLAKKLQENAKTIGKRDAIREKAYGIWETHSWADYADNVRRLALGLAGLGFKRGDKLAVIGDNRPRAYYSMLAAQSLGGISLAVYQDSIATELGYVLEHAETRFIVAENEEQVDKLFAIRDRLGAVEKVIFDDSRGMEQISDEWLIQFDDVQAMGDDFGQKNPSYFDTELNQGKGEDVAIFCYTSGTTGNPKGVMLTNDNLILCIRDTVTAEDLRRGDELIAYLPMAWVGDFWLSAAAAIDIGMTVNCPENAATLQRDYREIGPSVVVAPPAAWEGMLTRVQVRMEEADKFKRRIYEKYMKVALEVERLKESGESIPGGLSFSNWVGNMMVRGPLRDVLGVKNVRLAYTGGAPLGPDVFRHLRALGINLKQLYGMTESSSACVYQPDGEANAETVGRPLSITEVKISDSGEIMLRGPNIFKGYFKNDEATAETIDADGWMASGDAGIMTDNGHLKVIDRAKDVSRLNDGTIFAPQYIENKLKFSPYIKEAVTLGRDRDFVSTMINIDLESLENWAEREGLAYTGYQDLSQKEEVYALIHDEIDRINADLAADSAMANARIRRFLILSKELDADDGEITRTRKLRRNVIADRYESLISALYNGDERVETDVVVTYEDGSTGSIHANLRVQSVGNWSSEGMRKSA
ncbi:MAG: AMP-binding protein [Pseudomonadota bacterium]